MFACQPCSASSAWPSCTAANAAGRAAFVCLALILLPSLTAYLIDIRYRGRSAASI
jgi:hypothetical protein